MTQYKISRAEFYKAKWVIYFSVVDGNCFCSIHDRTGLTDEQAAGRKDKKEGYLHGYFRRAHYREVKRLIQEKKEKEDREANKSKIILS